MDLFSVTGGKKLRCGYTTGSCAAAAAKAAARMALTGEAVAAVSITTPQGVVLVFKERRLLLNAQEGERIFALYWQEVPVAGAAMEQGVAFYSADEETL